MINLDQHSKDQNNNNTVLAGDWHKNHAVIDSADPAILSVDPTLNYSQDDSPVRPLSARPIEPVTPADAVDPVPAPSNQNPSPETPGDLLSAPNDDNESNSTLSPVPSPDGNRDPANNDAHPEATGDVATDDPTGLSPQDAIHAATSRQSTPLTELSGPMSPSRGKDEDVARPEGGAMETDESAGTKKDGRDAEDADGKSDTAEDTTVAETVRESGKSRSPGGEGGEKDSQGQVRVLDKGAEPAGEGSAQRSATGTSNFGQTNPVLSSSTVQPQPNGIAPNSTASTSNLQLPGGGVSNSQKTPPEPPDEKASTILQLNTELLKVCMECQTRHMMQSSEFNAYATRLQSNLTWLAAAADRERHKHIPLPIMSPPTAVPWSSTRAINDYYQRLPNLFAKEIAKRQREASQASAGGVKRGPDTTADDTNGMRKRVDTGERRLSNSGSAASPPHVRSPSVLSNGTVGSTPGLNTGMNVNVESHGTPAQGMSMGMIPPQQAPQQQPPMRISPETMLPASQQMAFPPSGMSEAQVAQARERARLQMRQSQQAMAAKEPQRMPPPSLPNGLSNPMAPVGNSPAVGGGVGQSNNTQVMQAILSTFGQAGLQNYHSLQQGGSHPFVNYMNNNVPGFLQLPLQQQLQRMQIVQNNIQQVRAHQAQRAAAAANAAGMNGMSPQGVADPTSPFGRHSGSPPNVNAAHLQQQHQGQQMQQMSPSSQASTLPYAGSNGMGLPMQANMQPQRPGTSVPQNMAAGAGMGGLPPGINMNNLTPQQRQLFLMQQQMHQRGNDGVMNPQQAYAAAQAQEKLRQEQQSRMSNHQQHSPPHNAGSPPNPGSIASHVGMGTPGMPGIARSARSPTEVTPVTPRMPQKRPMQQNDTYHMALYNQAQAQQRQASMGSMGVRPGTAMGGMTPQQQQQQASPYGANGGTINPGMMYGGATGMNAHSSPQQNWQTSTPQQQQQFHSVSPAALQHHPDSGTPRPGSSASNNAVVPGEMGDSFDSLFNWSGS